MDCEAIKIIFVFVYLLKFFKIIIFVLCPKIVDIGIYINLSELNITFELYQVFKCVMLIGLLMKKLIDENELEGRIILSKIFYFILL